MHTFRLLRGNIDRIERVDTTFADLNFIRMRNVNFTGNVFHGVNDEIRNPLSVEHRQDTRSETWVVETDGALPFGGRARTVTSIVPEGRIVDAANQPTFAAPWVDPEFGPDGRQFRVVFDREVRGTLRAEVRMDNPM